MKLKFLILLILGLSGCKQELKDKDPGKAVKQFVQQLKQGTYKEYGLPEFEPRHIPDLLQYSNDTTVITEFPRNGISSAWIPEVYLGTYILWTVESVRARAIHSRFLVPGGFPSLNPFLRNKIQEDAHLILSKEAQKAASDAYTLWWNRNLPFDQLKNIDPLAATDYEWR